jgi:trans-aconitate methyltransferase
MDEQSRARLTELYRRSLDLHGPTARGQRWSTEESQRERFRLLAQVGPWPGRSLADVGCGVGDLLSYLRGRRWGGSYEGFDIVPEMVAAARRKQRGRRGRFSVRDVLAEGFPRTYDYVLASGTFNLRIDDHERFFRRMIEAMYAACRRGVAFNVLRPVRRTGARDRAYDVFFRNSYFVASRKELRAYCAGLSAEVELLESETLPEETTVLLRRPA